jgi:hypothetical protein
MFYQEKSGNPGENGTGGWFDEPTALRLQS